MKKALITPLRDRWAVKIADGPDLDVKGNIVDHEYTIEDGRTTVAEVSKKWFRVADTYGVEVAPGQDPALILAVTAVLDTDGARGALTLTLDTRKVLAGPGRASAQPSPRRAASGQSSTRLLRVLQLRRLLRTGQRWKVPLTSDSRWSSTSRRPRGSRLRAPPTPGRRPSPRASNGLILPCRGRGNIAQIERICGIWLAGLVPGAWLSGGKAGSPAGDRAGAGRRTGERWCAGRPRP